MDPRHQAYRIDEILMWRVTAQTPVEAELRAFLREFLLFQNQDKRTGDLRKELIEELETIWGQLLVETNRNLSIKRLFSKAWRRVESRVELTPTFVKLNSLYRRLQFE